MIRLIGLDSALSLRYHHPGRAMSIAARIASQPDKAGEVLQTIHKLGHCDKRQSLMQEFINAYRGSDQSVMISMISGDLSRRLMDVLLESHLCGYSIPQLTALPKAIEYDPRVSNIHPISTQTDRSAIS